MVKPLAATLMDKGMLPLMGEDERLFSRAVGPKGFRFEIAPTHFPQGRPAARYVRERERWVMKRAFDGKDTHIGISRSERLWREVAQVVTHEPGYVAQEYVSLPRARLPVFVDEKHLEWVDSKVELSSFIYDGHFGGAAARHAPDAEGLVMSDIPEGYGFSTVFAV
ncbi:MAG: hypothetical protein IPJ65_01005 [Archangiaceae bacterium]|nr:hypothetical protein [Archangiaceae bacterium]